MKPKLHQEPNIYLALKLLLSSCGVGFSRCTMSSKRLTIHCKAFVPEQLELRVILEAAQLKEAIWVLQIKWPPRCHEEE
jgi:hypothetical protein